jgi:methionyl aminopeptidase
MGTAKISIKTEHEIRLMRESCSITADILADIAEIVVPGITTEDLNKFVHERILAAGGTPSTLHYRGYPKSCCTSLNDVICHGIPSSHVVLKGGDIINIDVTTYKNGFHGDASCMYLVGGADACSSAARDLVAHTKEALARGIQEVKPGARIGNIGAAIQDYVRELGIPYGIVREYTGHGVGREFHEPPQVVHVGRRGTGEVMRPGMTFTIEPMINQGTHQTVLSPIDQWTVRTADGKLSAQWEHTVLVTEEGVEILTVPGRSGG